MTQERVEQRQDVLQSQANKQDIAIAQLNNSICTLTGSVDKLTDRIDKRIDESDKWRRDHDGRLVAVEVITARLEKMFWLMGTAAATAGITSAIALIMHLLD